MKSKPKKEQSQQRDTPAASWAVSAKGSLAKGWALQFPEQSTAQMLGIAGSCVLHKVTRRADTQIQ